MRPMNEGHYEGIAIIGMAGRFPGAESIEQFWANLVAGKESISFFSDAELAESGLDPAALRRGGHYVPARGVLEDADRFDAAFFGVHPKEAEVMDPQHRVFLETCWAALERAGYAPNQMRVSVGVFGGTTFNTYYMHALHPRPELIELVGSELASFGNERDYLTPRVAYKLGLKGPALNVSTACSTSLVAVCQACQSLLTYQCDMALAGGSSVRVPQKSGYYYDEGNIGSSDGHTRTFDVQSAGTAFSNGVAIVVLKRLEDAVHDGDKIYAVIKGAALNNDGSQRVSFGAPGVEGQSEVIAMAHALAGVDPETITCVEAHGTATPLGDPIEVAGLTKAFRLSTQAKQFCALGSVKTNLGHLDAAAGVTGLIKTALALHHKVIPASLHFTKPNPKLDLENSPFYVNATLQEWKTRPGVPRRAGVSSFGTGGTNAHVVLEEAPELASSGPSRPWQLLVLSAKTPEALDRATANLSAHLNQMARSADSGEALRELADAAFTLQTGRSEFVQRRIVACHDAADGAGALEARDPKRVFTHHQQLREPPVVFMFPGQGAQYAGMGAELYRSESVFLAEVDHCAEILRPFLETDLRTILFPAAGSEKEAEQRLVQTRFTQPALFVIEYALAHLWMSWGIKPAAMIGHSVGEYVAGCLAGVFTLEDALSLVARRGALVQAQPGGGMLAIRLPENEVLPLLNPQLAIAAINSPNLCVVSGPHDAITAFEKQLESRGVAARHLHTSHAFHSPMMEPVLAPFTELLRGVKLGEPQIPYVSNVTARWITAAEAKAPEYWAGHVRDTVRFADGVAELMKDATNVLLEVGPGQTLSTLARQHPAKAAEQTVLASLPLTGVQEPRGMLETLGRLWMTGVAVDWHGFYANERRRRVVLPTYPFERKRYWPESAPVSAQIPSPVAAGVSTVSGGSPAQTTAFPEVQPVQTSSVAPAPPALPRKDRLLAAARSLLHDLSGYDLSAVDPSTTLLELGLDSLLLTQAAQLFQRKFGVPITFRQLMEELGSLDEIVSHLDATMPAEAFAAAPAAPLAVQTAAPAVGSPASSILEQLLQQQQQLTNQLLQLMGRQPAAASTPSIPALPPAPAASRPDDKPHGPFKPIQRGAGMALSPTQGTALDALMARYTRRTAKSKELATENRTFLADPRSVAGFKQLWKEMVYPIVTTRSDGSKVWDVDGNEYVDFVMGFGASMFGHRPPFVVKAVHEQLDRGFEIGPISALAGEVAALIREFTGMPRVAFTNTGSESVLAATRLARTVTGRDKIAVFAGSYHGIFDEVLFRPVTVNGETRTAPIAPGIPDSAVGQVVVLDYGNPQSLEILRARGSEIAAVLVEPVQSRRMDLQPKEFMHELRRITEQAGSALIFDEVVTGFRLHPGGAQAYFGVRADLATYGKVIGGGLPIGVVAGDPKFMDALDGGQWQYGDTSFPEVGVTFFAGTFVRHPLALAAAKAVLTHLKEKGPELQRRLNERTDQLVHALKAHVEELGLPIQMPHFASMFYLNFAPQLKYAGLFYYFLREKGIHAWDNRAFILTTAHSEEDLDFFLKAFKESLAEMQAGGFLPEADTGSLRVEASPSHPVKEHQGHPASAAASAEVVTLPLTEGQSEILLAVQMNPDASCVFNEAFTLRMRGPLKLTALSETVQELVNRHEALRTTFSPDGEFQRIAPSLRIEIPVLDYSDLQGEVRDKNLETLAAAETGKLFELFKGPLFRAQIVKLEKDDHVLILGAHHIICDGWSWGILVSELSSLYSSKSLGVSPRLSPPMKFSDFARWQAKQQETPEFQDAERYWVQQYSSPVPPLDLPGDHIRPAVKSFRGGSERWHFPVPLYKEIRKMGAQNKCTLFATLLAAFSVWLHRLGREEDLVVGIPTAGQTLVENQNLVGHCVNFLPLRIGVSGSTSFVSLLSSVKQVVLNAFDHQNYTFGRLLQKLKLHRDPSRPPLVSVAFNVDRLGDKPDLSGLDSTFRIVPKQFANFDFFFNVFETESELVLDCTYNSDLFEVPTVRRWLGHFQTLLEGIAANPTRRISEISLLTPAEQHQLLVEWNQTTSEYPRERCIHQLFEDCVEQTPEATAVICGEDQLTYRELNQQANQLAHHLRKLGVGPGVLVGICMERSLDMVVSLLAILKASGAYVPLDSDYPRERLAFMLEDTNSPVLLTQSALRERLPSSQVQVVCIDTDRPLMAQEATGNPTPETRPENLAYVMYTSGSTGQPKGVMVEHRSVVRLVRGTNYAHFGPNEVILQLATVSFDASTFEIWGALLNGGRLVLMPTYTPSLVDLGRSIRQHHITTLWLTAGLFHLMVEQRLEDLKPLRQLLAGGDVLSPPHVRKVLQGLGHTELINGYGPTENTTFTCCHLMKPGDVVADTVPIGRPISNTQVYLLDAHLQPVPIGVPGELYVGGDGLARGYLNRPELTAEKFILNPFVKEPGARLYKTGDLARYRTDGNVEFLGRRDQQVKIRGFRVELGEIEAALQQHAGVAEAVVVAREDSAIEKRLVAYVVQKGVGELSFGELRTLLKAKLPDHMVPSSFVRLEAFPLTPNGKVDRHALPAPESMHLDTSHGYVAPRTPTEEVLADIWAQVLGLDQVGVQENFFDLGGHSLLSLRVVSELEKRTGICIQPQQLILETLEQIAAGCATSNQPVTKAPPAGLANKLIGAIKGAFSRAD